MLCGRKMHWQDQGGCQSANDEESGDEGERPALSGQGVGHVVNVFGQGAEEQDLEDSDHVDRVQCGGDGQKESEPGVGFESTVEEKIFCTIVEGSG